MSDGMSDGLPHQKKPLIVSQDGRPVGTIWNKPMQQTGRIVKIVCADLKADRAMILNVAIHTIDVDKIKAPVAVIQGELCPRPILFDAGGPPNCAWCSAIRRKIEASRKE